MQKFAPFGVTQMTPPTGDFGLPFALLDGGNGKHAVEHGGALNIVTAEGCAPIKISKAVYAPSFGFDTLSVGAMEISGVTTALGPKPRLEEDSTCIDLPTHRRLFYLGVCAATSPGSINAALIAIRRRRRMPGLFTDHIDATPPPATTPDTRTRGDRRTDARRTEAVTPRQHHHQERDAPASSHAHQPSPQSERQVVDTGGLVHRNLRRRRLDFERGQAHGGEIAVLAEK